MICTRRAATADQKHVEGLRNYLGIFNGMRVMLLKNLWQQAGLVNGAMGKVKAVVWSKNEAKHLLKSRRMRPQERFFIQDNSGKRYEAVLISFGRSELTFVPEISVEVPIPSSLNLEILQALTKGKALDWILQKSTELGVERIDFFCGRFSPVSHAVLKKKDPLNMYLKGL